MRVTVQGAGAPSSIARAVTALSRSDCDVIAVVRGGGARADMAAFENEAVVRAIATATKPVFTGIGHTGDETLADIVAARACITPTECGQQIVEATRLWWTERVVEPAALLARRVPAYLERRAVPRHPGPQSSDGGGAPTAPGPSRAPWPGRARRCGRAAPDGLASSAVRLRAQTARLGPLSLGHLGRQDERVQSWRRLLAAYDVERQLERGYSLTLTADGDLVRSASGAGRGTGDRDPLRRRYGAEPGARERGRRKHMTDPDVAVPVEQLSFTEASRELDSIVNFFEQREVDVDVLVGRLERATALIDELDQRLRRTQAQVEELVPRLDALAGNAAGTDAGGSDDG